jgi:hypothetical protein
MDGRMGGWLDGLMSGWLGRWKRGGEHRMAYRLWPRLKMCVGSGKPASPDGRWHFWKIAQWVPVIASGLDGVETVRG